ncbi:UV radiation resistance-associated gene protein [Malassezia restricta CBS 7877]|uniref:Autophagy-related protein 14 n=1 Tax=Malassezia restricta (strain ATCC 96810 / NBRC 103918 / CBS 7877) TaxID=425264 RepID=A0A3G2S363_MALR7|nr:UV radiation resistance-associated gene protein [Malassezia restricta CBS 7877]
MARIQSDAHHTKDAERLLALRCTPALQSNSVLTQRRYKFELRHTHDLLRRARRNREQALSDLYDTLEARQKALGEKQQQLQAIRARMKTIRLERTKLSHDKDLVLSELNHVQKEVGMHRARLLRDLDDIYPIQLVHARDLLYSIVDLPLPNGIATTKENTTTLVHRTNLDETSAALTYVAQLMILLSTYLHTTLPYPLTSSGSRATVQDRISIMTGPRSFILSGKDNELYRYEYAVFLLNKDLERLMNQFHVPLLDLRNTLPNLKNLLVTLSAATLT